MKNNKFRTTIDLIEFVSKPMKKEDVLILYRVNNVIPEKMELYLDFIQSLFNTVTSTYLGDDVMSKRDIKKHFGWCWNQVVTSFRKEHIYFEDNIEIYSYFSTLFTESFYEEEDKSEANINELMDFWSSTFKYIPIKTRSELETLFDLYKLFDKSIHV
jgi:anaerobic ribonucleoside-triphosphate reductase